MNPAQATRLEKEKHPERFCRKRGCLWRETHRGRSDAGINESPDTPCPKHMAKAIDLMEALKKSLKAEAAV